VRIDVGGYRLAVTRHPAIGEAAQDLILLHGFAGTRHEWQPTLARLTRAANVYTVDLIGHGESDAPTEPAAYRFDAVAQSLDRLRERLGLRRAHWAGYSLGARLLLGYAVRYPEGAASFVFESVHPGIRVPAERTRRTLQDDADARLLETQGIDAFLQAWHERPIFDTRKRQPLEWRRETERKRDNDAAALARCLRGLGLGRQPDWTGDVFRIRAPVLFITGALDLDFTAKARELVRHVSVGRVHVQPDVGHGVHLEAPDAFSQLVAKYIQDPRALLGAIRS
jgi:2-succinyl-6-hydroxy-2,4-cyclohexadiene-1-carboxylate synthase